MPEFVFIAEHNEKPRAFGQVLRPLVEEKRKESRGGRNGRATDSSGSFSLRHFLAFFGISDRRLNNFAELFFSLLLSHVQKVFAICYHPFVLSFRPATFATCLFYILSLRKVTDNFILYLLALGVSLPNSIPTRLCMYAFNSCSDDLSWWVEVDSPHIERTPFLTRDFCRTELNLLNGLKDISTIK